VTASGPGPDVRALLGQLNAARDQSEAALLQGDLQAMHDHLAAALDALATLTALGHRPRSDQPPPAPWDEAGVTRALWLVLAQLKHAGCGVFPFAGTLLGLERDGRLLPNDKDVDLAVWLEDFQLACRTLEALGFLRANNAPPFGNVASFLLRQPHMSVDLFGIRREPEHSRLVGGAWLYGRPPSHQRIVHYPWFELASRSGPAGAVWWPQPPDAVLTALYGDWRTPQPEWDSLVSCRALQETNLQWRCWALKNLCDRWLTGDLTRTRRLLARCGPDPRLAGCCNALDRAIGLAPAAVA
jgi:hypothetical protein